MGKCKSKICEFCGKELPANREYFKRRRNKDIGKEDLMELWELLEGKCAISKIPMTFEMDNGRVFTNISINLIDTGQGYTKENVQLICQAVNQLKSDWSMDTVLYICKSIVNNYLT